MNGGGGVGGFRAATPNKKGQYSDAVLSELESQNEDELQGMTAKVRMLKDVCFLSFSPSRGMVEGGFEYLILRRLGSYTVTSHG